MSPYFYEQLFGTKITNPMEIVKMDTLELKEHKNPLVIYHGNCADGFTAAWCFYNVQDLQEQSFDFHAGKYGEAPPDVTDRVVYIVDFSYKPDVMEQIIVDADQVIWIDHHKSAIEELIRFYEPTHHAWEQRFQKKFIAYLDLERSGAMLAWDYLHNTLWGVPDNAEHSRVLWSEFKPGDNGYTKPPILLEHIQDRDLWKFKLGGTRAISAGLFAEEYDFEIWDALLAPGNIARQVVMKSELIIKGEAIEKKHFKDIREMIKVAARWLTIGGVYMPVLNCPYMWGSDACDIMAKEFSHPNDFDKFESIGVAAYYWDEAEHRCFGLRSRKIGDKEIDVSQIAQQYGGGGHKNASGFKVRRGHYLAMD